MKPDDWMTDEQLARLCSSRGTEPTADGVALIFLADCAVEEIRALRAEVLALRKGR